MPQVFRDIKFLFTAPLILLVCVVVDLMTSPGLQWAKWAALGLGIAWFIALFRVLAAAAVAGGLAALFLAWRRRRGKAVPPEGFDPGL
jgi:hypothetical protein